MAATDPKISLNRVEGMRLRLRRSRRARPAQVLEVGMSTAGLRPNTPDILCRALGEKYHMGHALGSPCVWFCIIMQT